MFIYMSLNTFITNTVKNDWSIVIDFGYVFAFVFDL